MTNLLALNSQPRHLALSSARLAPSNFQNVALDLFLSRGWPWVCNGEQSSLASKPLIALQFCSAGPRPKPYLFDLVSFRGMSFRVILQGTTVTMWRFRGKAVMPLCHVTSHFSSFGVVIHHAVVVVTLVEITLRCS